MNWRIWYNTGETVDGVTPEDWANAPDDGVVGIAVRFGYDKHQAPLGEFLIGSDWYWMYDGKLYQSGTTSEIEGDWLDSGAPAGAVLKKARWTTDEYIVSVNQAMLDWVQ
jgi:hypothetical protein